MNNNDNNNWVDAQTLHIIVFLLPKIVMIIIMNGVLQRFTHAYLSGVKLDFWPATVHSLNFNSVLTSEEED